MFDERNIYLLLLNLRHVIHIPSVSMDNPLCCGSHFSNITFIDVKTKYRSPYLLAFLSLTYRTISGHL